MGSDEVQGLTARVRDGRTLGIVVGVFGFVVALIALISIWLVRAHGRFRIEDPLVEKTFQRVRDHALRRLTTSGVLAGLSATAFAALLNRSSSSGSQPLSLPNGYDAVFRASAGIALVFATLGFLAVALSAHRIRRIVELSPDDLDRKREAIDMHEQADGWITRGFVWLGLALLCIAFGINLLVGLVAMGWTLIVLACLPALRLELRKHMWELLWPRPPASGPRMAAAAQTLTGTTNPDDESPTPTLVADRQTAILAPIRTRFTACRAAIPPVWLLAITMLAVIAAWLGRHR